MRAPPSSDGVRPLMGDQVTISPLTNKPVDSVIAAVALLVNALLMPGLGSILGGRIQAGIWQLVLGIGSVVLMFILVLSIVGILLMPLVLLAPLAAWIWAIVTGISLLMEASRNDEINARTHHNA